MSLRRGLFRLWLVLSAAFIVVMVVISGPRIEREFANAPAEASIVNAAAYDAEAAAADANAAADTAARSAADADNPYLKLVQPKALPKVESLLPNKPAAAPDPSELYRSAWLDLGNVVVVALAVPLLVLAFGSGLWWAVVGFGRRPLPPKPNYD